MVGLRHEEFWIVLLNRGNYIISKHKISSGGITGTVADIKIIFKLAVENLATSMILSHNHPSGNPNPSNDDQNITRKLKAACETIDVQLHDHLIIAGNDFTSMADKGMI